MTSSQTRVSKFLSLILRHKPETIGIRLDAEGWASINEIIEKSDLSLTVDLIEEAVKSSDKQRFALSPDGQYIRANQGHSVQIDLGLSPVEPPEYLFHGTATRFAGSIARQGLLPRQRQYVHLSSDIQTAQKVGVRHGELLMLTISAAAMHNEGMKFYQAENGVWLTDKVPVRFIDGL